VASARISSEPSLVNEAELKKASLGNVSTSTHPDVDRSLATRGSLTFQPMVVLVVW
jgi:hypothetical protein